VIFEKRSRCKSASALAGSLFLVARKSSTSQSHRVGISVPSCRVFPSRLRNLLFALLFYSVCVPSLATERHEFTVGVSIPPLAYLTEEIAGEGVRVAVLLREGADPHAFEPSLETMRELSSARLFISAGLSSEQQWLAKLSDLVPSMQVLHLAQVQQADHFWLSPVEVLASIDRIEQALVDAYPEYKSLFERNAERLRSQVKSLHEELTVLFANVGERRHFLVMHPAWTLFARDYDLKQIVIEQEGGLLTVRRLAELMKTTKALGIDTLFSEVAHPSKEARTLSEQLNAEMVLLNPLGRHWPDSLRQAAALIKAGLR